MTTVTIVHQGALGDSVLLIPLIRALRQRFAPACSITFVTRANLGQMFTMLGFTEAYASAEDRVHTLWFAPPEEKKANSMPEWAQADVLISAVSHGCDDWAANARLARHAGKEGDGLFFFEPRPPGAPAYAGHVTQWHREQLGTLQLSEAPPPLLRFNPDGPIVIHPGSGGDAKCWPRERFVALGRTLKRNGIVPTFVLGEAEQEKWGRPLMEELKDEFPWYLHVGLYELAERLSRARLYVGNDSGVTHLAAAVGVPVLALFGPSDDRQWRPIGPEVKVLRAEPPHGHSLDRLEEADVLAAILEELRKLR